MQLEITWINDNVDPVSGGRYTSMKQKKLSEFREHEASETLDRENVYVEVGHNIYHQ